MASASLSPKSGDTETTTLQLASNSATGAQYLVSGRALNAPKGLEIRRMITKSNQTANDHIVVRLFHTEPNVTTGKLATAQVMLDISVPKDLSVIGTAGVHALCNMLASTINNYGNNAADTSPTVTSLISGMDL